MKPLFPPEYLIPAIILVAIAFTWAAWRSSTSCNFQSRCLIAFCRFSLIVGLGVLALNLGRWKREMESSKNVWAVLVDRSSSMAMNDVGNQSRWEAAGKQVEVLRGSKPSSTIRWFTFSDRLTALNSPDELSSIKPDGEKTDIVSSCNQVLDLYRNESETLEGIILITDGRQVEPHEPNQLILQARTLNTRIHPLALGGKVLQRDISVQAARRQYVAFKQRPVKITAIVKNQNMGPVSLRVHLLDDQSRPIAEKKIDLANEKTARVEFEVTPAETGYREYLMKVDPREGEYSTENNDCKTAISTLDENIRVLYLEGNPTWDSKFIAQALQNQQHIHFQAVYRISQDRYFRIESGSAKGEEVASPSLPTNAEEFRTYDVIILGKGAEYFMEADTHEHLQEFIRDKGGCLLFARGKSYIGKNAPLESLDPVVWEENWNGSYHWNPTALGEDTGLFQDLLPDSLSDTWKKLPPLNQAQLCSTSRAFTQVLVHGVAASNGRDRKFPAVVSQRMGRGLILLVNSEGLWQWDFFPSFEGSSELYRNFWFRLLQWAVTYSDFLPGQHHSVKLGETVTIPGHPLSVKVLTRPSATPPPWKVRILSQGQVVQEFTSPPNQKDLIWEGMITLNSPGNYRVELTSTQPKYPTLLNETIHVRPPPSEKDEISADPEFLIRLAKETGGAMIDTKALAQFFTEKPKVSTLIEKSDAQWEPKWDRGFILMLILIFPVIEWSLRRRAGLI
jgi:hypothetical protein